MIPSVVFVAAEEETTEEISTLQQIFKKSWEHVKDLCTCFVDLGKVMALFLVKSFGWYCGSTVLTVPIAGRQVTAFLFRSLYPCRRN